MKIYKIVFSPTGGTEKAARIVSGEFGTDIRTIDLTKQDFDGCTLDSGSLAVIAIPSFGGRAPKTAIERLKKIHANGSKAVVIAVYGNREQEDTLIEMADTAKECGFEVIAGISAVAEHSIAHQYAAGRPNSHDEKQLRGFTRKIKEKLNKGTASEPDIPGNRPYKKAGAGLVPKATSRCNSCRLCAKKCPVGAISKKNPKKVKKSACINCMRCVSICPKGGRKVSGLMVKIVGMALKKACSEAKENQLFI